MTRWFMIVVFVAVFSLAVVKYFINRSSELSSKQLDISVCDPAKVSFSPDIRNPYFPYPVGKVSILEDESSKVQISSLGETKTVAGVETRVIEEKEWEDGNLTEISRNYFAQTMDGTVCYFGEDVDIYENGKVTSHEGSWKAGEGQNKAGIIMPAGPSIDQSYPQEIAPGVAEDSARHEAFESSFTTPAGTFNDVLLVKETPASIKRYAKDVGLIFDDGMVLVKY